MNYQDVMANKHASHIAAHERAYGAPLGEMKNPPSKEQLDKDFEKRQADGTLFTQTNDLEAQLKNKLEGTSK